ncbi:MAG: hypothetical protein DRR08_17005 [Candidatus Parabeggiatoa sp. nov. 2]|nr:MAG: hypothetical protein B6247_18035 [Beggiatoa sp. 4572_84]RKZ58193.1 MAG: hypothetical protein DRR08_17005 [Gammaproteobacteria bacterium]HEC84427.1 tetratricopeptide repeat protein [Thioploca sp.]
MKKFHLYIFMTLLFSCAVNAADFSQLEAAKAQLQEGVDTQKERVLLSSLRAFKRLRREYPSHLKWLLNHYIGLNYYRLGTYYHHVANNEEWAEESYQKGLKALKRSANQHPFAETDALISAINGNLIPLSWWWSKISLGMKSGDYIEKARKAGPQNPRVWLLSGIGRIFTPKTYGGGAEPALRDLNKSIRLFENQGANLGEIPLPSWGIDEAYYWQGIVFQKLGRDREALAAFRKARRINPRNARAASKLK